MSFCVFCQFLSFFDNFVLENFRNFYEIMYLEGFFWNVSKMYKIVTFVHICVLHEKCIFAFFVIFGHFWTFWTILAKNTKFTNIFIKMTILKFSKNVIITLSNLSTFKTVYFAMFNFGKFKNLTFFVKLKIVNFFGQFLVSKKYKLIDTVWSKIVILTKFACVKIIFRILRLFRFWKSRKHEKIQ